MGNIRVVPSGGWSFPRDGLLNSQAELHVEPGYIELVEWLRNYRIANGKEVGDPELDVNTFIAQRNPRQVGILPLPDPYAPSPVAPRTLRDRVTNWLAGLFQFSARGIEYAQEEDSEKRAQICADCPHNLDWKTGCPPCVENAERVILMLSQARTTSVDSKLFACNICGHANKVAVTLDEKHLTHADQFQDKLPDFCWLKKE